MKGDVEELGVDFGLDEVSNAGHLAMMTAPEWLADDLVAEANTGDKLALFWVSRIVSARERRNSMLQKKALVAIYADVAKLVGGITGKSIYLMNARTGENGWKYLAPEDDSFPNMETVRALRVARIIGANLMKGVKRCVQEECKNGNKARCPNFFFSVRRREYCMKEECERNRERTRKARNRP